MEIRKISLAIMLFLMILMSTFSVLALTAKIGNARAIINAEVGDTVERTIKIINDNNVSVLIELFTSGDLMDDIKIIDNNFTLEAGETKDARFEIYIREEGRTESNINVKFSAIGEKQGVGISSTLIINAVKGEGFLSNIFGGDDEIEETNLNNAEENSESSSGVGTGILLIIILVLVLIALIVVFFYLKKRAEYSKGLKTKPKKNVRKK